MYDVVENTTRRRNIFLGEKVRHYYGGVLLLFVLWWRTRTKKNKICLQHYLFVFSPRGLALARESLLFYIHTRS